MKNKILFIGNQGAESVLSFYKGMAQGLAELSDNGLEAAYAVWHRRDRDWLKAHGIAATHIECFEDFVRSREKFDIETEAEYLNKTYPKVHWSLLIAAERSFTDYSMLLGTSGNRPESSEYVQLLLSNLVRFFEFTYSKYAPLAVITQTSDTLISFVSIKVAQHLGIIVRSIVPAWLLAPGEEGGFFADDEFMHCRRMYQRYETLKDTPPDVVETGRASVLADSVRQFDGSTSFYKAHARGRPRLLTPHLKHLANYIWQNGQLDKNVVYTRFSVKHKAIASLTRLWRERRIAGMLGDTDLASIPEKSVFFAMHMQPEQSTLAQGIWYINQIALIENISKSLPVGYTLIVKEHPINRGFRPAWQYHHLRQFYNVMFCDAASKEIVRKVEAVITITGTIGMESLVMGKPVVMLGATFYDFTDLLFKPASINQLPEVLYQILIERQYVSGEQLQQELKRFLIAYQQALIPHFPLPENGIHWGKALLSELEATTALKLI